MNDPSTDQAEKNRLLAAMNDQLNLNISFGEKDPKLQEKLQKRRDKKLAMRKMEIEAEQIEKIHHKEVESMGIVFDKQMDALQGHLDD